MIGSVMSDGGKVAPRRCRYMMQIGLKISRRTGTEEPFTLGLLPRPDGSSFGISTSFYPDLINAAAAFAVDVDSEAYEEMYKRLDEWKKTGFHCMRRRQLCWRES